MLDAAKKNDLAGAGLPLLFCCLICYNEFHELEFWSENNHEKMLTTMQ